MAVILRYFSEFRYLSGVLRKSSRSLSHLLVVLEKVSTLVENFRQYIQGGTDAVSENKCFVILCLQQSVMMLLQWDLPCSHTFHLTILQMPH